MAILHRTVMADKPPPDPRDPPVHAYVAPPLALCHAKALAAVDRALERDQLRARQRLDAHETMRQLVVRHGALYCLSVLKRVAAELEVEG